MLRDNLAGLIEPMLSSAGAYPLALATDRKELSDDRPQYALKIPARQGGIYALTENVASPFHAEPRQSSLRQLPVVGRIVYPMRAKVTMHVRLGCKSLSCPAENLLR